MLTVTKEKILETARQFAPHLEDRHDLALVVALRLANNGEDCEFIRWIIRENYPDILDGFKEVLQMKVYAVFEEYYKHNDFDTSSQYVKNLDNLYSNRESALKRTKELEEEVKSLKYNQSDYRYYKAFVEEKFVRN